jgi:hypothetical protein
VSALPGALTANGALRSAPLGVALPAHPSADSVRAAMVAAGAIARAQGGKGIHVYAVDGPTPAQLLSAPGPVLAIVDRPGAGSLSLSRLSSGRLELTVAGHGASLLAAARTLSSPWIHSLSGVSARIPAGVGAAPAQVSAAPAQLSVAPAGSAGVGTLRSSSTFSMPVDQVVTRGQAVLRVGVSYDAPSGGRVRISLNGNTLGAYTAPAGGSAFRVSTFKLSSNWTENGNLLPGYFLQPGSNRVSVTATPLGGARDRGGAVAHLSIDRGSGLAMATAPRPSTEQLSLWPFPFYGAHAWTRTTVVMARTTPIASLSALIGAMANAERVTGVPSDPVVTYRAPTAAQRSQNLIVAGPPTLAAIAYSGPLPAGLLAEVHILLGGTALVGLDDRAFGALGYGYQPGSLNGRVVLVGSNGQAHTIVDAPTAEGFGAPPHPWLAPAALIAALVLGWVVVQMRRARRRLVEMPELPLDDGSVLS